MANAVFYLMEPTSISYTGTSASISANGSVSFTSCSSLSLNGVFSAGYDNYRIVAWHTGSVASTVRMRLRASGADTAGTGYTNQIIEAYSTTVAGRRDTSQSFFNFGAVSTVDRAGQVIDVYGSFLSQPTASRCVSSGPWSGAFPSYLIDAACIESSSTSFDGFTLLLGGGVMSGRVAVYGMRK
jgi:hypothetical protein